MQRLLLRRTLTALALSSIFMAAVAVSRASAAIDPPHHAPVAALHQQQVDDNDGSRVEVQLVVLGIAAGLVVGLGLPLYLLRKKLGLVKPPPAADESHH